MTSTPFYTNPSKLFSDASEAVTERVGQLAEEQFRLIKSLPEMRAALLLHAEKIKEELHDADFRFFNGDKGLVFEVHSPSAKSFHMTKESFRTALASLKEQFGMKVEIGFTDEEREIIRTGGPRE